VPSPNQGTGSVPSGNKAVAGPGDVWLSATIANDNNVQQTLVERWTAARTG